MQKLWEQYCFPGIKLFGNILNFELFLTQKITHRLKIALLSIVLRKTIDAALPLFLAVPPDIRQKTTSEEASSKKNYAANVEYSSMIQRTIIFFTSKQIFNFYMIKEQK